MFISQATSKEPLLTRAPLLHCCNISVVLSFMHNFVLYFNAFIVNLGFCDLGLPDEVVSFLGSGGPGVPVMAWRSHQYVSRTRWGVCVKGVVGDGGEARPSDMAVSPTGHR